jgi:hypothetical protein
MRILRRSIGAHGTCDGLDNSLARASLIEHNDRSS